MEKSVNNSKISAPGQQSFQEIEYRNLISENAREIDTILQELYPEVWKKMLEEDHLIFFLEETAAGSRQILLDNLQLYLDLLGPAEFMKRWHFLKHKCLKEIISLQVSR